MVAPAPIALFAFNRPDHLRRTVEALRQNPESARSDLVVFCDGPRGQADVEPVEAVRRYARAISGFASLRTVESPTNLGLARSVIDGVEAVLEASGRVIVVEDDLVTSPHFLRFMNQGLDRYASHPEVCSIHGYVYPVEEVLPEAFFLRGADCWGWATWTDAWSGTFDPDGAALLRRLKESGETERFNFGGSHDFLGMLQDQVRGRNQSWAIRWHASAFLAGKHTLYPGRTLVRNIGLDASGTHCGDGMEEYASELATSAPPVEAPVEDSLEAVRAFTAFFRRQEAARPREDRPLRRRIMGGLRGMAARLASAGSGSLPRE